MQETVQRLNEEDLVVENLKRERRDQCGRNYEETLYMACIEGSGIEKNNSMTLKP